MYSHTILSSRTVRPTTGTSASLTALLLSAKRQCLVPPTFRLRMNAGTVVIVSALLFSPHCRGGSGHLHAREAQWGLNPHLASRIGPASVSRQHGQQTILPK